jgi:polyhydroxybutyrate depolymerase
MARLGGENMGTLAQTGTRHGFTRSMFERRTYGRRALFALTLGASIAALSGCRSTRAGDEKASAPTQAPQLGPTLLAAPAVRAVPQAAPGAQAPGRSVQLLTVGDVERRYVRYEPPTLDRRVPAPFVLALHGRGGNGRLAEWMFGFNALADAHGFVVVYPDALGDPPTWNEGFVGLAGGPYRPDDVGFVRALVAREQAACPLDTRRLFVCGHSSGGMMTYRLASEASDLFAAAGVVAGSVGYAGADG